MKKLVLSLVLVFALFSIVNAQFTSVQSGKWWYPSTWSTDPNATAFPDSLDDVIVKHDINLDSGGRCKNLTVDAGGRIHNGTAFVYGSVQNYGTINGRGEWYGMKVALKGDLINYGNFDSDTDFNGSSDQYIVSADTIVLGRVNDYNSASKIIINGPAIIKDTWFFLRGSVFEFYDTLRAVNFSINGGIVNGNNNVFLGYQAIFGWTGAVSFGPDFTTLKNMTLEGDNYITGAGEGVYGVSIGEGVKNNGSLNTAWLHGGGSTQAFVDSDFENNGSINEQQDGLTLIFRSGDFINNGELNFKNLTFINSCSFVNTADTLRVNNFIGGDSTTVLNVTGDLIFGKTINIDFHGGTINLEPNSRLDATYQWYNMLQNVRLNANNSTIIFAHVRENCVLNNPRIRHLEFRSNSILTGNVEVINDANMQPYYDSYSIVTIDGNIKNSGHIRNHQTNGTLFLRVNGNIEHSGPEWSNSETKLTGIEDQEIVMPSDSAITGKVIFDAILSGTNYQWQKDGVDIAGANSKTITFTYGLSSADYGTYQCDVDGNSSRKIFVGNTLPNPFEIYDVAIKNLDSTSTLIAWKTTVPATGFIFYAENDNSSGYPMEAMEPTGFRLNHSLILDNLTAGSTYYFIIDQNDDQWNNVRSEEYVFVAGDLTLGALAINSITDVPNDQGGWVHVNFNADALDSAGDIKLYGVWEYSGEEWVSVGSVPATQDSAYTFLAHTYADSNNEGIHWSKFYITAHSTDPLVFYNSPPDSGYSIDNIAPAAPSGLIAEPSPGGWDVTLTWNRNTEKDFAYYKIYRDDEEYATTIDTLFIDNEVLDGNYEYKLKAYDANGNESKFSDAVDVLVGVEEEEILPEEFELSQNYPNPFNPTTTIKFSIPAAANVQVKIYNSLAQEIQVLVNRQFNPGYYEVNWDASNYSSGIYYYTITAKDFTHTRKMLLLK